MSTSSVNYDIISAVNHCKRTLNDFQNIFNACETDNVAREKYNHFFRNKKIEFYQLWERNLTPDAMLIELVDFENDLYSELLNIYNDIIEKKPAGPITKTITQEAIDDLISTITNKQKEDTKTRNDAIKKVINIIFSKHKPAETSITNDIKIISMLSKVTPGEADDRQSLLNNYAAQIELIEDQDKNKLLNTQLLKLKDLHEILKELNNSSLTNEQILKYLNTHNDDVRKAYQNKYLNMNINDKNIQSTIFPDFDKFIFVEKETEKAVENTQTNPSIFQSLVNKVSSSIGRMDTQTLNDEKALYITTKENYGTTQYTIKYYSPLLNTLQEITLNPLQSNIASNIIIANKKRIDALQMSVQQRKKSNINQLTVIKIDTNLETSLPSALLTLCELCGLTPQHKFKNVIDATVSHQAECLTNDIAIALKNQQIEKHYKKLHTSNLEQLKVLEALINKIDLQKSYYNKLVERYGGNDEYKSTCEKLETELDRYKSEFSNHKKSNDDILNSQKTIKKGDLDYDNITAQLEQLTSKIMALNIEVEESTISNSYQTILNAYAKECIPKIANEISQMESSNKERSLIIKNATEIAYKENYEKIEEAYKAYEEAVDIAIESEIINDEYQLFKKNIEANTQTPSIIEMRDVDTLKQLNDLSRINSTYYPYIIKKIPNIKITESIESIESIEILDDLDDLKKFKNLEKKYNELIKDSNTLTELDQLLSKLQDISKLEFEHNKPELEHKDLEKFKKNDIYIDIIEPIKHARKARNHNEIFVNEMTKYYLDELKNNLKSIKFLFNPIKEQVPTLLNDAKYIELFNKISGLNFKTDISDLDNFINDYYLMSLKDTKTIKIRDVETIRIFLADYSSEITKGIETISNTHKNILQIRELESIDQSVKSIPPTDFSKETILLQHKGYVDFLTTNNIDLNNRITTINQNKENVRNKIVSINEILYKGEVIPSEKFNSELTITKEIILQIKSDISSLDQEIKNTINELNKQNKSKVLAAEKLIKNIDENIIELNSILKDSVETDSNYLTNFQKRNRNIPLSEEVKNINLATKEIHSKIKICREFIDKSEIIPYENILDIEKITNEKISLISNELSRIYSTHENISQTKIVDSMVQSWNGIDLSILKSHIDNENDKDLIDYFNEIHKKDFKNEIQKLENSITETRTTFQEINEKLSKNPVTFIPSNEFSAFFSHYTNIINQIKNDITLLTKQYDEAKNKFNIKRTTENSTKTVTTNLNELHTLIISSKKQNPKSKTLKMNLSIADNFIDTIKLQSTKNNNNELISYITAENIEYLNNPTYLTHLNKINNTNKTNPHHIKLIIGNYKYDPEAFINTFTENLNNTINIIKQSIIDANTEATLRKEKRNYLRYEETVKKLCLEANKINTEINFRRLKLMDIKINYRKLEKLFQVENRTYQYTNAILNHLNSIITAKRTNPSISLPTGKIPELETIIADLNISQARLNNLLALDSFLDITYLNFDKELINIIKREIIHHYLDQFDTNIQEELQIEELKKGISNKYREIENNYLYLKRVSDELNQIAGGNNTVFSEIKAILIEINFTSEEKIKKIEQKILDIYWKLRKSEHFFSNPYADGLKNIINSQNFLGLPYKYGDACRAIETVHEDTPTPNIREIQSLQNEALQSNTFWYTKVYGPKFRFSNNGVKQHYKNYVTSSSFKFHSQDIFFDFNTPENSLGKKNQARARIIINDYIKRQNQNADDHGEVYQVDTTLHQKLISPLQMKEDRSEFPFTCAYQKLIIDMSESHLRTERRQSIIVKLREELEIIRKDNDKFPNELIKADEMREKIFMEMGTIQNELDTSTLGQFLTYFHITRHSNLGDVLKRAYDDLEKETNRIKSDPALLQKFTAPQKTFEKMLEEQDLNMQNEEEMKDKKVIVIKK